MAGRAESRVDTVMRTVRERLAARSLVPGERLPSIRGLADSLGVSKTTVVEAYDRLAADGVIEARRGSGFYVCGHPPPLSLAEIGPAPDRSIDPLWISRQSLEASEEALKPGCGWLPQTWLPDAEIRRALRQIAREPQSSLLEYGRPYGHPALREQLARRLAEHGVAVGAQQIVLTDSGTQAIDLICRFLLEPGDTVLLDDPGYFNFQALLRAHRVQVIGVPYTPNGPDIEALAGILERQRPRLYITNSAFHNPTGAVLSPLVAHRLLKLAEAHDLLIVEDDIFADFELENAPRLSAFDGLERVIQVGSFSKTLSASVRCGFIAARADWCEQLVDLKLATSFGNSPFSAELLHELLRKGSYRRHVESLRARLADAMGETLPRLRRLGLQPWLEPRGGIFVWAELPEGLDGAAVSRAALAEGVVLAPGNVFSLSQSCGRFLRFNVAQCQSPRVFEVLERAMGGVAAEGHSA
ncbi:aminotransferase-like domain-containing protein [Pseudomonas jinjuensis]|uniref:DNA-binding transcriptional regulator, MocR family, contains an aminotransferase domain n=1 Tax=Pseudomonas jinjuensis TaxID=198616 RepID=A0A1H0A196_9PSED|nr:PLP-dependent aminotransferase family protein [Pseudomonas jinjuensis]SDN26476.1 DNA-binding transcriptional regulator, MocR family, contains an aminotransferase domain [Pseudomonas jinjuensis]